MWQGKYYTNNARNTRDMHTIFQHKLKGIIVSLQWNILISIFQFHNVVLFRVLGLIQVNFTQNLTVSGRNPGVLSLLTWQFAIPKHPSVLKHLQRLCLILLLIFVDILRMMFTYCDYKYSITYKNLVKIGTKYLSCLQHVIELFVKVFKRINSSHSQFEHNT